jgi:hemolysin III
MTAQMTNLDVHGLVKPLLRGRIHLGALFVAVPAVTALVVLAASPRARIASAVYGATLVAVFAVSASYHRFGRTPRSQQLLRRADHATIFGLIAGSYTPVAVVAIGGWVGWSLVIVAWSVAALGMVLKVVWFDRAKVVGGVLYIALGWMVVVAGPFIVSHLSPTELLLLVAGGLLYTGGSIVLHRRRPDPFPLVFGYHEVWHACVVVAAACQFAAILLVVRGA